MSEGAMKTAGGFEDDGYSPQEMAAGLWALAELANSGVSPAAEAQPLEGVRAYDVDDVGRRVMRADGVAGLAPDFGTDRRMPKHSGAPLWLGHMSLRAHAWPQNLAQPN